MKPSVFYLRPQITERVRQGREVWMLVYPSDLGTHSRTKQACWNGHVHPTDHYISWFQKFVCLSHPSLTWTCLSEARVRAVLLPNLLKSLDQTSWWAPQTDQPPIASPNWVNVHTWLRSHSSSRLGLPGLAVTSTHLTLPLTKNILPIQQRIELQRIIWQGNVLAELQV